MSENQVETVHGPVEYETVECESCNQEYVPAKTVTMVLGEVEGEWDAGDSYDRHIGIKKIGGGTPNPKEICESCAQQIGYDDEVGSERYHLTPARTKRVKYLIGALVGVAITTITQVLIL